MQKTDNWQRIWNDNEASCCFAPARTVLYSISLLYRLIINLRNWLYDHKIFPETRLSCPVISVGNITVGGTGKTPCVIWLARMLKEHGFRPVILSRGYGGKSSGPVNIVSDGKDILVPSTMAGDEPYLIARTLQNIPVITGPKRVLTGKTAIDKFKADVLICDDAFQHRQIFRNINLVLLDSAKPLGNGHLLPRGPLREPRASLRRANAFILTRSNEIKETINQFDEITSIPVFSSSHQPVDVVSGDYSRLLPLAELKGKKVCAFAGIAKPDSFKNALLAAGAQIISYDIFSDHHLYSSQELENIHRNFLKNNADLLITTEKDGMRLLQFPEFLSDLYLLRIELKMVPGGKSLQKFILEKLGKTG